VRVPLLDHRLVEAVLRLPEWVQQNGAGPKALLVDALGRDLPTLVRERRDKMGFSFPFGVWVKEDLGLKKFVAEMLNVDVSFSLSYKLQKEALKWVYRKYKKTNYWPTIWGLSILVYFMLTRC